MDSYGMGQGEFTPEMLEAQEQEKAAMQAQEAYAANQQPEGQPGAQSPTGEQQQQETQSPPTGEGEPDTSGQRLARQEQEQQQEELPPTEQFAPWDEGYDIGDGVRTAAELITSVPVGATDFGVDLINMIPGVNIPKLPTFQSESVQTVREIGNVAFGAWLTTKGLRVGTAGLVSKIGGSKLLAPVVKHLSGGPGWLTRGSQTTGRIGQAAVGGYTAEMIADTEIQQDETIMGELKNASWVPGWMKDNIPEEWTNIGITDPDLRRERNRNESLGLGIIVDAFGVLAQTGKAVLNTNQMAKNLSDTQAVWDRQLIAKNGSNIAEVTNTGKNVGLDPIERSLADQVDSLDELGVAAVKGDPEALNKPTKGIHNTFDVMEEGTIPVSKDGVMGALADQVQIKTNTGSVWGRVGSVISDSWAKFGPISKGKPPTRQLIDGLTKQVREIGDVDMILPSGIKVDSTEFNRITDLATMEELADAIFEVKDTAQVKGMLDRFRDTAGTLSGIKNKSLAKALDQAILRVGDELFDLDRIKVQNIVQQSAAGQVADVAEAVRISASDPTLSGQVADQALNKLVYLLTERGMWRSRVGSELSWFNLNNIKSNPKAVKDAAENLLFDLDAAELQAWQDAKRFTTTLGQIQANKPEFLKPMWLAYELTDGKVNDLYRVSEYMKDNLSSLNKAVLDGNSAMPNQIVAGMWSNVYNSVLSSFATPTRAAIGNIGGLITKPVSVLGGAAISGDIETLQRGAIAMGAVWDSLSKGSEYFGNVFRKVSTDPYSYGDLARKDIMAVPDSGTLESLKGFANAAEAGGDLGPAYLVQRVEELNDLAASPFLRFGTNLMSALDGFTSAMVGNMEARYLAIDELAANGTPINMKTVGKASKKYYDEARKLDFNPSTDNFANITPDTKKLLQRTKYQTGEIALNLDNDMSRSVSKMIAQAPILKPLVMFPRTSFNMLEMFDKYSPVSVFVRDANEVAFTRNIDLFPEAKMRDILMSKGIISKSTPFEEVLQRFKLFQAETRGRKAIGTLAIGTGITMAMQGKITGYGVTNEEVQRNRELLGIPKLSIFDSESNEYVSYEGLGPITDIVAAVATIYENMDTLGTANTEQQLAKLSMIIGSSITDRSVLKNIENLFTVFRADGKGLQRVLAQFANGVVPLAGQRAEWGRFTGQALKEHNKTFTELLRNRNKFITNLPTQYDFLYGDPVGGMGDVDPREPGDWLRVAINATTPFKTRRGPRPEAAFLADIEYDMRPMLSTDGNGIPYPPEIRSQINKIIADRKVVLEQIRIEKDLAERTQWVSRLRKARRAGATSTDIDLKFFTMSHERITQTLNREAKIAESYLSDSNQQLLNQARLQLKQNRFNARSGIIPEKFMQDSKLFK